MTKSERKKNSSNHHEVFITGSEAVKLLIVEVKVQINDFKLGTSLDQGPFKIWTKTLVNLISLNYHIGRTPGAHFG